MPESPGNIEEIHNSLKASLSRGHSDLDKDVVAASKRVLLEKILFQPASASYTMQRDALRTKYIPLNPAPQDGKGWTVGESSQKQWQQGANTMAGSAGSEKNVDCLPIPKVVLYPEERLKMEWTRMTRIGAGLVNMGNTCFFNSTLQCLTYTVPLVNYCFTNDHREKCKKKDFCMMCEIQNHIKSSLDCGGRSIKPHSMLQKLRCIAKHMKWGRQEDAHEFLRFVVDHLQQACLNGETKLDRFSKETTVINQIFGGYLRSQVTCLKCQSKSDTFDPFMDLSLDIKGVKTVEEALSQFVKPETLENDNAYKCPKCKNKVRAQKRFSIEKAPNVLTLQLNRFDFHHHLSGKINRFIKYPEKINLRSYMSQRLGEPVLYHLYGVLVHSGHSSEHGHYYSFVKSPSKAWYCMNDSFVHQAGSNAVFSADAYVLFYARINKRSSNGPSTPNNLNHVKSPSSPIKSPFIGPTLPSHLKQESHLVNGIHGKPTCEIGTPIKQQPSVTSQAKEGGTTGSKLVSNATVLSGTHNKISFPILTPLQKKQHLFQQQLQKDEIKRIVLQIKNGNSTTMEKSPDGKSKVVNGNVNQNSMGLVPYNDDSDSEQENVDRKTSQNSLGVKVHNQKEAATSSLSLQTSDSQCGQTCAQKLSFPPSAGNGGFRNLSPTKSVSGNQASLVLPHSHKDIPPSSCNAQPQSATSSLKDRPKDLLHTSAQSSLAASSTNINHRDLLSTRKQGDVHRDLSLSKPSSSTSLAAGKGSFVELPVVNMSSYADQSSAKVKSACGNWLVQAQDCAPSPRSSCSSSNSVNSTTEWTVESKDKSVSTKSSLNKGQEAVKGCVSRAITSFPHLDRPSASNNINNNAVMPEVVKLKDNPPIQALTPVPTESPSNHNSTECSHLQLDRITTPVEVSEKLSLLHSPSNSGISDRKEKKHKKKHKKDSDLSGYEKLRDDSSSRSDTSSKRKKKHKKEKKRKHKDSVNSDSDSYEGTRDRNGGNKNKYSRIHSDTSLCSDEDRQKHRKKRSDSKDSDGYEWVEKTIETTKVRDSSNKSSRASVQSWNHHVKDDVAPKKPSLLDKIKSTWDGSRSSKLGINQHGTSFTFGSSVIAWDGHKNHNDRDIDEERVRRKRQWSDDYNEEIDAGKTKKVKAHAGGTQFSSDNPFQRYQSMKIRHEPYRDNGPSWSQDHSYHQHDDHHYQKNSQFQWMNKNNYRLQNRPESQFKSFKPYSSTISH